MTRVSTHAEGHAIIAQEHRVRERTERVDGETRFICESGHGADYRQGVAVRRDTERVSDEDASAKARSFHTEALQKWPRGEPA